MRQIIAFTSAAVMLAAGAAFAQSGSSGATQQGSTAGERVTLTGCVGRADQFNPSGAGPVGTTLDSMDFVLIKADEAGATASEPASAVGTSGSIGPMYRLIGDASEINPHVGQKVELTGVRQSSDVENAAAQAANANNPSAYNAPRVRVESIKTVMGTCPR